MGLTPEQLQRINRQTGGAKRRPDTPEPQPPRVVAAHEGIAQSLMRARKAKQGGIVTP